MTFRFRFFRWLALQLMPASPSAEFIYFREKVLTVPMQFPDADFDRKYRAAFHIAAHGVGNVDLSFLCALMSPLKEFTYDEAQREAFAFLDSVHSVQLAAMPLPERSRILQGQAERLFSE